MFSIEKQWYLLPKIFLVSLQNRRLFQEEQTKLAAPEKKTNVHETTGSHFASLTYDSAQRSYHAIFKHKLNSAMKDLVKLNSWWNSWLFW